MYAEAQAGYALALARLWRLHVGEGRPQRPEGLLGQGQEVGRVAGALARGRLVAQLDGLAVAGRTATAVAGVAVSRPRITR